MNYKKIMHIQQRGKKIRVESEWKLIKMNPSQIKVLQKLELIPKAKSALKPKRKRGRPRKNQLYSVVDREYST